MTKKHKQKRGKAWISWVFLLVLLIIAGVVTYMVWNFSFTDETKTENVEVVEEESESTDDEAGEASAESAAEEDDTNGGKKVKQFEGEDPNKLDYLTGVITSANIVDDKLIIRTNIDQFLESGSCELKITRNNNLIYSETSGIMAVVSTSSCQGFDVPVAEIGNGDVQIIINVSSGEKTGTLNGEAKL